MNNKPYAFLGQYLVGNGLITQGQLDEAVRLQKESRTLIGTIALDQGFLDQTQLNHLIERQVDMDEQFGKLAIQEGFMREDQLEALLAIQAENHLYLGESLVRMGTITDAALSKALSDFEGQIIAQEEHVREELGHLPVAKEVLIILDVTLRFFYRLGYALHVVGKAESLPEYVEQLFLCEQILRKPDIRYMGLGMTNILIESIAQGTRLRERFDGPSQNAMENMSQVVFNLNYLVCKVMKRMSMRVKHGASFIRSSPDTSMNSICIEVEAVNSPMVIVYSH